MSKGSLIVDLDMCRSAVADVISVDEDRVEIRANVRVEGSKPVVQLIVAVDGGPPSEAQARLIDQAWEAAGRIVRERGKTRDAKIESFKKLRWSGAKSCTIDVVATLVEAAIFAWYATRPSAAWPVVAGLAVATLADIVGLARRVRRHGDSMRVAVREAVVATIIADGPSYGLELMGKPGLDQGTMYPILRCMEAEGTLSSEERGGFPGRGGRPRVYYRLASSAPATIATAKAAPTGATPTGDASTGGGR